MKMLFFSSDSSEVQFANSEFRAAGIPCEIRNSPVLHQENGCPGCAELWICNDRDCHRALMLCVQLGIGFSRRPRQPDIMDLEAAPEEEPLLRHA
jgi:hypothetical protein